MNDVHGVSAVSSKMITLLSAITALSTVGCGGPGTDNGGADDITLKPESAGAGLTAVASLTLANGNTVTFYEAASFAMVTEKGKPPTPPSVKNADSAKDTTNGRTRLVSIWKELAPARPVPSALVALDERIALRERVNGARPIQDVEQVKNEMETSLPLPQAVADSTTAGELTAQPAGNAAWCNTGCCDRDWLYNSFNTCRRNGSGDPWFPNWYNHAFNVEYGWSALQQPKYWVAHAYGMTCAAVGTSVFYGRWMDDGAFDISVPEGWYYTMHVYGFNGTSDLSWMNFGANSQANQHVHSFCAGFIVSG